MKKMLNVTRKEKGQSLVELALVFLLLLLLLTGIIDLGSMFYSYTTLRDTSQEGAIYASTHPTDLSGIRAYVKASANYPIQAADLADADITTTCYNTADGTTPEFCATNNTNSCQGQKITVNIVYRYKLIMPIIPVILARDYITLVASVTNTIIQSPDTISVLSSLPTPVTCP